MQVKPAYLIAETAYSFQGELQYLKQQIHDLKDTGIDCIKFHLIFDQYSYAVKEYKTLHDYFDTWILKAEEWKSLLTECKAQGLDTLILADDVDTIVFCNENPALVDGIEVHAACVNDLEILDQALGFAAAFDKTFYIGVSGFEYQELSAIIEHIRTYALDRVVLMYGFQNFPTRIDQINLCRISLIQQAFGFETGYADHTRFDDPNKELLIQAAYAQGARVLEIHYVLKEGQERIDYITALDRDHLVRLRSQLQLIHQAIGQVDFRLNEGEKKYLNFRKVPVYSRDLPAGHILQTGDILFKRVEQPSRQHRFREAEAWLGFTLNQNVKADSEIMTGDLHE